MLLARAESTRQRDVCSSLDFPIQHRPRSSRRCYRFDTSRNFQVNHCSDRLQDARLSRHPRARLTRPIQTHLPPCVLASRFVARFINNGRRSSGRHIYLPPVDGRRLAAILSAAATEKPSNGARWGTSAAVWRVCGCRPLQDQPTSRDVEEARQDAGNAPRVEHESFQQLAHGEPMASRSGVRPAANAFRGLETHTQPAPARGKRASMSGPVGRTAQVPAV